MSIQIKNILVLTLIGLAACLNFSSCTDDNFVNTTTETEETFPESETYVFMTGKVKDNSGNNLPNITVQYSIEGESMSMETDEDGVYIIRDTDTTTDRKKIKLNGEGYLAKMDVLIKPENNVIEKDIILAREGDFSEGPGSDLSAQTLTDSLIAISGQLVNDLGEGIAGLAVILVEISDFSFSYGISDEEGYWSIAHKPSQSAVLGAYSECEGFEALADQAFLEDTNLGELTTSLIKPELVNFSGFITDCNTNEGLVLGSIQFSFVGDTDIITADILDGNYSISVPKCQESDCIDVTVFSTQTSSGVDNFDCQSYSSGDNVLDFEVCNEPIPDSNGGFLSINLDGSISEYEFVVVGEDLGRYFFYAQNVDTETGVIMETENMDLQGSFANAAVFQLNTLIVSHTAVTDMINYQIDSITTEFMYGIFEGEMLEAASGLLLPVEGEFKAKL